ncbi:BTB/POZ domain-containing protein At1g01640 [Ananas comosus]|uniref:BTB/POZ domain-containing protein At1g01640 n=1 Tax=Ananas comosus TaxID=4615 RepID=A0A6P5G668_ANACO|nr:BTB/POZ domain-containing protein At1g01640 [Ananas comosus]
MDCCICSPMASLYRPPRNTICPSCYEGAKCMISFINELEIDLDAANPTKFHGLIKPQASKGISDAFKCMKEMREREEEMREKLGFLDGLVLALREGIHTDILIKPGRGPPIPAHRAILATRSEIFRHMLSSDDACKAPAADSISLPELSHDDLRALLDFVYAGALPLAAGTTTTDIAEDKRLYSLLIAADKYDIPFLRKLCVRRVLVTLRPANALGVLEVAETCSDRVLKDGAMRMIAENLEEVVFSEEYEAFATTNAHLAVEITRAVLTEKMRKKAEIVI